MTNEVDRERILRLVYESIDEVNRQFAQPQRLAKTPDTRLLGDGGQLDSLGFVNLVAAIEERCEATFGVSVSLTSGSQDSADDRFDSVASVTDYLQRLLKANGRIPE